MSDARRTHPATAEALTSNKGTLKQKGNCPDLEREQNARPSILNELAENSAMPRTWQIDQRVTKRKSRTELAQTKKKVTQIWRKQRRKGTNNTTEIRYFAP
jgi:hypothetical protein